MSVPVLDEASLDELYQWLDRIPFSRRRKNVALDFSDGVLVAELVHNFLPTIVDLHNYTAAAASVGKRYNWAALNKRVFAKIGYTLSNSAIQNVISGKAGAIEFILLNIRPKIEHALAHPEVLLNLTHFRSRTGSSSSRRSITNGSCESLAEQDDLMRPLPPLPKTAYLSVSAQNSPRFTRRTTGFRIERMISCGHCNLCQKLHTYSYPHRIVQALQDGQQAARSGVTSNCSGTVPSLGTDDLVSSRLLYEVTKKLLAKEEKVQVLQARISHLERLSDLKDKRINDITNRIELLSKELFRQHNINWTGMLQNGAQNGHPIEPERDNETLTVTTIHNGTPNGTND